ncbi:hypothetical protein FOMPIDRAFT_1118452 [Fomitopsis schrenkii]|uniref:Uncharacterized protein n=1 Tax=Fomitopsis schrenkii TaxID=2126942 RepID=S8FVL0_FOMSC|nr:hypothetical protein FOMPIDRAFT_1118452 [Fomitopsis schrenkii]
MLAFTALLPIVLAAGSLAMPAVMSARQDSCTALGAGASSSLTYNFQLEGVDPSASNNATGAVLALVNDDSNDGFWFLKNATGDFSGWKLNNGALIPSPSSNNGGLVGSEMTVPVGSIVEFAVTNNGSANASAGQTPYCAVVINLNVRSDAGGHATLAVNGDANSFSVCQTPSLAWVLVYSASIDNNGAYTYSSCAKQNVHLVQA